jgi:hypothetical protein
LGLLNFNIKKVSEAIHNKVRPEGTGREDTGYYCLDGKKQLRVTIPRGRGDIHPKTCTSIKNQLHLRTDEFRDLVSCRLTDTGFESLIREKIKKGLIK